LLYATAPDAVIDAVQTIASDQKIKRILKEYDPFKRFIYQNAGAKARNLFDQSNLPSTQRIIRKRLKNHKLWVR
jgi:hypothetical protein